MNIIKRPIEYIGNCECPICKNHMILVSESVDATIIDPDTSKLKFTENIGYNDSLTCLYCGYRTYSVYRNMKDGTVSQWIDPYNVYDDKMVDSYNNPFIKK